MNAWCFVCRCVQRTRSREHGTGTMAPDRAPRPVLHTILSAFSRVLRRTAVPHPHGRRAAPAQCTRTSMDTTRNSP